MPFHNERSHMTAKPDGMTQNAIEFLSIYRNDGFEIRGERLEPEGAAKATLQYFRR